jgi:hypothetical protein
MVEQFARARRQGSRRFVRLDAPHGALLFECEALLALGAATPDLGSRLSVLRERLAEHCPDEEQLLSPENLASLLSFTELEELQRRNRGRFAPRRVGERLRN